MNFQAAIHPFQMKSAHPKTESFFANIQTRHSLLQAIRNQIKWEKGSSYVSDERGNSCICYYQIERNNFLGDLQEYAASLDKGNLEAIYMGIEQTRFNHLIEIRNNIGIYLPIFLFFPLQIAVKQKSIPIFVGSSVKLHEELKVINQQLKAHEKIDIGEISDIFQATEEDVEDYEAIHEGVENFWPSFSFIILERLVKKSLQHKLPLFIFGS